MDQTTRRLSGLAVLAAAVTCLGLTAAPRASAHSDDGYFDDVRVETTAELQVSVEALLLYEDDDDPAPDATVTLVAEGPQGEVVGPVRMDGGSEPGHYTVTATLTTSGTWVLRLSSLEPDAVLRSTQKLQAPGADEEPTGPADTGDTEGGSTPTDATGAAASTPEPTTLEPPASRGAMAVEVTGRSTGAAAVGTWAAAGAAVVLVGAAVWLTGARRR